jgi:hypothetical protein
MRKPPAGVKNEKKDVRDMFAVIKTGGKQYTVAADDLLKVEKLDAEAGSTVTFDEVLMVGNGTDTTDRRSDRRWRERCRRSGRPGPQPQDHHLQEAPPSEFAPPQRPPPERSPSSR